MRGARALYIVAPVNPKTGEGGWCVRGPGMPEALALATYAEACRVRTALAQAYGAGGAAVASMF